MVVLCMLINFINFAYGKNGRQDGGYGLKPCSLMLYAINI